LEGARRDVRQKSETNEERTCVNAGYRLLRTRSGRAHAARAAAKDHGRDAHATIVGFRPSRGSSPQKSRGGRIDDLIAG
jgi:hypothetical protein